MPKAISPHGCRKSSICHLSLYKILWACKFKQFYVFLLLCVKFINYSCTHSCEYSAKIKYESIAAVKIESFFFVNHFPKKNLYILISIINTGGICKTFQNFIFVASCTMCSIFKQHFCEAFLCNARCMG